MEVSKKKIMMTRVLLWGGVALMVVGIVLSYISDNSLSTSLYLLLGGLLISFLGAFLLKRLFRCPHCKVNVLGENSNVDLKMDNVPQFCPKCGARVQIVE